MLRRAGGIAVMVFVVLAKMSIYGHVVYDLERASMAAYNYMTGHNAHKLAVDPKDGRNHHA